MLGRGLQFFAVNGEVDDDFIRVVDSVRDGVETDAACFFIPCKDIVPDLDLADGSVAFVGGDGRVRTESNKTDMFNLLRIFRSTYQLSNKTEILLRLHPASNIVINHSANEFATIVILPLPINMSICFTKTMLSFLIFS